jgi:predicted P-loop ATPase
VATHSGNGVDIHRLRTDNPLDEIARRYGVRLAKDGREWRACCPLHAEDTASFTVFHARGGHQLAHCFGCGFHGDVIDFVREVEAADFRTACDILGGWKEPAGKMRAVSHGNGGADQPGDPYAGFTIHEPPASAPVLAPGIRTSAILNPKRRDDRTGRLDTVHYTPTSVHPYPGIGYVLRVDIGTRKITPAILWMKNTAIGFEGWSHGSMPEPRPLYGLQWLAERQDAQVLIVEGEKCADASAVILGDLAGIVAVSWAGGGKAWRKTDWAPLAGRRVVLWPDNDAPGVETMRQIAGHLVTLGCAVKLVDLQALDKPDGWDIADAVAEGWTAAQVVRFARERARPWIAEPPARQNDERTSRERQTENAEAHYDNGGEAHGHAGHMASLRDEPVTRTGGPSEIGGEARERSSRALASEQTVNLPSDGSTEPVTPTAGPPLNQRREVMLVEGRSDDSERSQAYVTPPRQPSALPVGEAEFAMLETAARVIGTVLTTHTIRAKPQPKAPPLKRDNIVALPGVTEIPIGHPDDYRAKLIFDGDDKVRPKLMNNFVHTLMGHDQTHGMLAWNEFSQMPFIVRKPPWRNGETDWTAARCEDTDVTRLTTWLEKHGMTPKSHETREAIRLVAGESSFNPVRDYLDNLVWDGTPRLQGGMSPEGDTVEPFSAQYLGSPPDAIFGAMTCKWFISAIARVMHPGCQMDTILTLESPQGYKKSSFFRTIATIAGVPYFYDDPGNISDKDSIIKLHGKLIIEIAELASLRRHDIYGTNAWITRRVDTYRPPYERTARDVPRQFVLGASVNPSGYGFLRDPTGARRFWIVPVARIDIAAVERDRDQIWAEAVALYNAGRQWWLTEREQEAADELTKERYAEDAWAGDIEDAVGMLNEISLRELMQKIGIPAPQRDERTVKRLSEYLTMGGWRKTGKRGVWARASVEADVGASGSDAVPIDDTPM